VAAKPWQDKRVVIIDDSTTVREELKHAFQACGMQVVGMAENGAIGLEMVGKHRPEIVSLDLIMPEMDGVECYRKIQELDPTIKCIIITWIGAEPKILENLSDKMPAHLFQVKPVTARELEARLDKIYFPQPQLVKNRSTLDEEPEVLMDLGIKVS